MATYPPVIPAAGSFTTIAAVAVDRLAVAYGGSLWLSDDASPSVATSIPLMNGSSYLIAANRAVKVASASPGAQLRLMDY